MCIDSCGFNCVCIGVHGITATLASPRGPGPHSEHAHMAQTHVEGVDLTTRMRAEVVIGPINANDTEVTERPQVSLNIRANFITFDENSNHIERTVGNEDKRLQRPRHLHW